MMKLNGRGWLDMYINAYYYMTVTMVTVGYGDITPVNKYERSFSILTMLIACGIFAYSVSSINTIVNSMNEDKIVIN